MSEKVKTPWVRNTLGFALAVFGPPVVLVCAVNAASPDMVAVLGLTACAGLWGWGIGFTDGGR